MINNFIFDGLNINKMKTFLLAFLTISLFLRINSNGQEVHFPIDTITNLITYSEITTLNDSAKKNELFARAKSCMVHLFKNSNEVIQNEDKENCVIIGKGLINAYAKALGKYYDAGFVNFTITIACKDGRYKYVITELVHDGGNSNMPSVGALEKEDPPVWTNKQWQNLKLQTDEKIKEMISFIKSEMLKASIQKQEW